MSEAELIVLVPSRSRPEALLKCWESVRDTSDAAVLAYVDKDQEELYRDLPATIVRLEKIGSNVFDRVAGGQPNFVIVIGPRVGPLHAVNTLCHAARMPLGLTTQLPNARAFAYLTDDSTIGPAGWDKTVLKAIDSFPNRIGVVSLWHGADYVNFYAISSRMVEAIGAYAIPSANHAWYWDTAMELIGDASKIVYTTEKEVSIAHNYQITKDALGVPDDDLREFCWWCITGRKRIIQRVRAALGK